MRVTGTGAAIVIDRTLAGSQERPALVAQAFVEVVGERGVAERWWGSSHGTDAAEFLDGREDPTTTLMECAREQQEHHLAAIIGDLRINEENVTRWEVYSAPFRVELSDELWERLAPRWSQQPPRNDEPLAAREIEAIFASRERP